VFSSNFTETSVCFYTASEQTKSQAMHLALHLWHMRFLNLNLQAPHVGHTADTASCVHVLSFDQAEIAYFRSAI
jgi:hypothetical protein